MSEIRCPNCDAILDNRPLGAGWCDNCQAVLPDEIKFELGLFDTASNDRALDTDADRSELRPYWLIVGISVLLTVAAVIVDYFTRHNVEIVVNNDEPERVRLFFDDIEQISVHPGGIGRFTCTSGARHIIIRRGDEIIFDQTKTLKGRGRGVRKYLIDTAKKSRFCIQTIEYSRITAPQIELNRDGYSLFKEKLQQVKLAPITAWIDEDATYVLEPSAKEIYVVSGQIRVKHKRIVKITQEQYNLISHPPDEGHLDEQDEQEIQSLIEVLGAN